MTTGRLTKRQIEHIEDPAEFRRLLDSNVRRLGYESLDALAVEIGCGTRSKGDLLRLATAEGVIRAGQEVEEALATAEMWRGFRNDYIRECVSRGLPKAWVARAAKVSRQAVYDVTAGS